jgi:hypothetical protein
MLKKFFVLISSVFLFTGTVFAIEFSADTVMTAGDVKTTGKIYCRKDKYRIDMKTPEEMITVIRMDKRVIWNIMPREKMYMEMPFSPESKPMVGEKVEGEIERKHVGSETIDGHPTKKYLVTYRSGNMREQIYQWLATDINFPVKVSAKDSSWVQEFKNIKMGSQPDSLFEIPVGYKKMQMPGGINFRY